MLTMSGVVPSAAAVYLGGCSLAQRRYPGSRCTHSNGEVIHGRRSIYREVCPPVHCSNTWPAGPRIELRWKIVALARPPLAVAAHQALRAVARCWVDRAHSVLG